MSYEIGLRHTIDAAHRVVGHEGGKGKCARLHGHTYSFEVTLRAGSLNETGFVLDYGVIKRLLDEWDHRTLLWTEDPMQVFAEPVEVTTFGNEHKQFLEAGEDAGVVRLPFNPTAENLAREIAEQIANTFGVPYVAVVCSETPKSRARWIVDRRNTGIGL